MDYGHRKKNWSIILIKFVYSLAQGLYQEEDINYENFRLNRMLMYLHVSMILSYACYVFHFLRNTLHILSILLYSLKSCFKLKNVLCGLS